ncbi:IBR finger domain protein [Stipitochalara longipes BDJ]|nr:IBR finger domain protein [Stipitochalara longipes BDJ]
MASTYSSKRTILITGCSDGSLGSHLAIAFHKAGWRVFASARNLSKLKSIEAAGIETLQLDTLSGESIGSCVAQIEKLTGGSLDTLLNNAGAGYSMPLMDLDLAKARDLFDLNVFSLISTTRAFLPLLMKSTKTHGGVHGGMVVNNTSCSGLTPGALPFAGAYNASKGAAVIVTEDMRLELAPFGIKVVNLVTGGVRSTFHANAAHPPLPSTSIYNVAKDAIEKAMSGVDNTAEGSDPVKWAAQVVRSLSKDNPSHWIYLGKWSTTVRLASFLPIGFTDNISKPKVGLDVLEQKLREREQATKPKAS